MADPKVKEALKSKLSAVGSDLKQSKIRQRINGVELIDGKLKAEFSVSGLPAKNDFSGSYRDFTKIFDDFGQFSEYSSKFFAMSDKEIQSLCENEK